MEEMPADVLVNDITARMHAEKELIDSRQQLLNIIDFLPDATFVVDNEKKVIAWNKAIRRNDRCAKAGYDRQGRPSICHPILWQDAESIFGSH